MSKETTEIEPNKRACCPYCCSTRSVTSTEAVYYMCGTHTSLETGSHHQSSECFFKEKNSLYHREVGQRNKELKDKLAAAQQELAERIAELERTEAVLPALKAELAALKAELVALKAAKGEINTNLRQFDLVRFCRQELHEQGLISDDEYAWLCYGAVEANSPTGGSPSPRRLEKYDEVIARADNMEEALEWYATQVAECNRHGPEGGEARNALAKDLGHKALVALGKKKEEPQGVQT